MNELAKQNSIPALSIGKFVVTPTGLVLEGEPSWDEWEAFIDGMQNVRSAVNWVIGDCLAQVEVQYGERSSQFLAMFPSYDFDRLRQLQWVSESIPFVNRLTQLSWTHHLAAAAQDPEDRDYYLHEAAEQGWSVRQLKSKLRFGETESFCTCSTCGHEHARIK